MHYALILHLFFLHLRITYLASLVFKFFYIRPLFVDKSILSQSLDWKDWVLISLEFVQRSHFIWPIHLAVKPVQSIQIWYPIDHLKPLSKSLSKNHQFSVQFQTMARLSNILSKKTLNTMICRSIYRSLIFMIFTMIGSLLICQSICRTLYSSWFCIKYLSLHL